MRGLPCRWVNAQRGNDRVTTHDDEFDLVVPCTHRVLGIHYKVATIRLVIGLKLIT